MQTDSETLMQEGIATAKATYPEFLDAVQWRGEDVGKTFCHQVGRAHRKLMLEAFQLPEENDFTTFETLGNTGSVALPITAAIGAERGHCRRNDRVALLGIGSGINVVMLGVDWQRSPVGHKPPLSGPHAAKTGVSQIR